ncbi:MAG: glycosyltransferase family 1 protein [Candidatus Beckwithbacteria bacterium]|nr:glycosyltransferase family 1 protein [Candidatus Beckwithbacteria bacterium]
MKIGIDISCFNSASSFRGIGFYTRRLIAGLEKIPSLQLIKFEKKAPSLADLVHYPGFNPFHFSLPLINRFPYVITVHDLTPLKFPDQFPPGIKGKLRWLIQKNQLRSASAIVTDSQISKKDIVKFTGISADKVNVVYLAPDPVFKPIKPSNNFGLPGKFILYVGDVNFNKNLPFLAKTCLKLNFPLVVVGQQAVSHDFAKHHPENQALVRFQELAKANPHKIITLGFVKTDELVSVYNLATVYCQPSLAEGFGLPVLEAMACGCPVITSKDTSLAEISGSAAILINPANPSELAEALNNFWLNSALREKYRQLGLTQSAKFSWAATAHATLKVYEKILNQQ